MRTLRSILRALCVCLLVCAMLNVCGCAHEHVMKTEWEKNATHHWRPCEDKDCTEVTGYSAHYWNDGEITTPPTAEASGEKTFTCEVCGATRGVPIVAE